MRAGAGIAGELDYNQCIGSALGADLASRIERENQQQSYLGDVCAASIESVVGRVRVAGGLMK
jgi:hypothetical protein